MPTFSGIRTNAGWNQANDIIGCFRAIAGMPRFKTRGVLERTALADLWKHTLTQIPTTYARLVYLASLRDPNSGAYRHHGLSASFGREESAKALKQSHETIFLEWLNLTLAEKNSDLQAYLESLEDAPWVVVDRWLLTDHYLGQIPDAAKPMERRFFHRDLEALFRIFKNASAAAQPVPGSRQPG
jgi:hypothetical protein